MMSLRYQPNFGPWSIPSDEQCDVIRLIKGKLSHIRLIKVGFGWF